MTSSGKGPMLEKDTVAFMAICDIGNVLTRFMSWNGQSLTERTDLVGTFLEELVAVPGRTFLSDLLLSARIGHGLSRSELPLMTDGSPRSMILCGILAEDRYLLVGGTSVDDMVRILDIQDIKRDSELARCAHLIKARSFSGSLAKDRDVKAFEEMARLNNEIVNTSRELVKKNRELTLEREKERITISSIGEAVIVTDQHLRVTLMNGSAIRMTGYSKEEAEGLPVGDVVRFKTDSQDMSLDEFYARALDGGISIQLPPNSKLIGKDGQAIPIEDSVSPIIDPSGKALGLVIIFRDISDRLQMERSLTDLNEMMHLINKTMRHDLQNGLNAARASVELFRIKKDDRNLLMAEKSLARCQNLIDELRKLELTTRSGNELKGYDIRKALGQSMQAFTLPLEVEGPSCHVLADEALPSVLENLIRNAIVHGKTDSIRVSISTDSGMCKVSIADQGIGIPDEVKSDVFKDGYSHGESKGTGLGLYIVKKVMERYGGSVEVRDNHPKGTIFDLTFRLG
jgi:PAS domain S-box-containing protein